MRYSVVIIVIIVVVIDSVIRVFVYSFVRFIYKVIDKHGSALDCTCPAIYAHVGKMQQ